MPWPIGRLVASALGREEARGGTRVGDVQQGRKVAPRDRGNTTNMYLRIRSTSTSKSPRERHQATSRRSLVSYSPHLHIVYP